MTADDVREMLEADVKRAGGILLWAIEKDLSYEIVRLTLKGQRDPGYTIMRALGVKRRTFYEYYIDEAEDVR